MWAVQWDNGNGASGVFPDRFETEEEAEGFATVWAHERNLEDLGLSDAEVEERGGEGCYTAEAIRFKEDDDAPDLDEYDLENER